MRDPGGEGGPVSSGSAVAAGVGVLVGLVYLAAEDLLDAGNVAVLLSTVAIWAALWSAVRRVDGGSVLGICRAYFLLHLVFVQLGCLTIYFASQSPSAVEPLLLGFPVEPSLVAVYAPAAGMVTFVGGMALWARCRTGPPPAVGSDRREARIGVAVGLLLLGLAYWAAAVVARGSLPLLDVLRGADAEDVRLDVHYGDEPLVFNSSVVQQVPLILVPAVAMLFWETSTPGSRRRLGAWVTTALAGALLLNSLERTSMVIVGLWWGLVVFYRRGRAPGRALAVLGAAFVAMTVLLHGGAISALRNQVFRRVAIVNAMVNYFVFQHYPRDFGLLSGSSYVTYVTEGILGSGDTFAKTVIGQLFPGQRIGTAPVGALTEAWANFGIAMVVVMAAQGFVFALLDDRLRPRLGDPLGRVYVAGMTLLLATTAYGGTMSVLFSGGVASLAAFALVVGRRPAAGSG